MSRFYYIDPRGAQIGPIERDDLLKVGISRITLVWKEGTQGWIPAEQEPELAKAFATPEKYPPTPSVPPPPPAPQVNYTNNPRPVKPSSYMWLAICSTILCCLPFGIVSIVYASKVDSYWAAGDYDMAEVNSNKAKTWGIAAAVTGGVLALVYMIIVFTATSSAVLSL